MKDDLLMDALLQSTVTSERLLFYKGEAELFYNDEVHAYYRVVNGEKILVPGVTTITGMVDKSGPLMWWAVGCAIEHLINNSSDPELLRTAYYAAKDKTKLYYPDDNGAKVEVDLPVILASGKVNDVAAVLNNARCAHNKLVREASAIGKDVHGWLEELLIASIQSKEPITQDFVDDHCGVIGLPAGEEQQRCCKRALEWMVAHRMEPILTESKIFSREYNFSGTLDWLAYITKDGRRYKTLGDFKTSRTLHDEYWMQVAAYLLGLTEEHEEHNDIESCSILRLGKDDGSFEPVEIPREELENNHINGFLGALQVYNWFKQIDLIRKSLKPAKVRKYTKKTKVVIPEKPVQEVPFG